MSIGLIFGCFKNTRGIPCLATYQDRYKMQIALVFSFIAGYSLIVFEHIVKVNKAAIALMVAVLSWAILFMVGPADLTHKLEGHLAEISQIIFFLFGAMAIVEMIDAHRGFAVITQLVSSPTKVKMMWLISLLTFFMSSVLDNLTTTIVMVSLLRKLIKEREDRWMFGSLVVIAANAGGAWTPIGDVTTTMLWINGQISAWPIMKSLFIPSLASLVVCVLFQMYLYRGREIEFINGGLTEKTEKHGKEIFFIGIGVLLAVPLLKVFLHIPPFMGILIGLGLLWLVTDLVHSRHEGREHLRMPQVIQNVDISSVLFFLGILLSISALESAEILKNFAGFVNIFVPSEKIVAATIGLASAIVDNVPLVAACMGMYDVQMYAADCSFWQMIAYCAGTGGSILIIGSAAGVALMGMEKVDFFWYVKHISLTALVGYFVGFGIYLILNAI